MNSREFRQLPRLTHLDTGDVINPPIWCVLQGKTNAMRIICKHYSVLQGCLFLSKNRKPWTLFCDRQPPDEVDSTHLGKEMAQVTPGCDVIRLFQDLWVVWRICRWLTPPSTLWGSAGSRQRVTSGSTKSSTSPQPEELRAWLVYRFTARTM